MSQKIVINVCFGGFGLSAAAVEAYLARQGKQAYWFKDARDENGRIQLRAPKVRTDDPDGEFIAYCYTTPEASEDSYFSSRDIDRDDPDLVAVVEEMGEAADGTHAQLSTVEVPDDVEWVVEEYDGTEHIAEKHRTWR